MTTPDPGPVPSRQEMEADRDRQGELDDRRHPPRRDVLHPAAEERIRRQVQLAGQRRMEVDPVSAVRPVVEQSCRGRAAPGPPPRSATCAQLLPPLGRHDLAVPVRRLVPGQAEVARRRDQGGQRDRENSQRGQPQSFHRMRMSPQDLSIFPRMSRLGSDTGLVPDRLRHRGRAAPHADGDLPVQVGFSGRCGVGLLHAHQSPNGRRSASLRLIIGPFPGGKQGRILRSADPEHGPALRWAVRGIKIALAARGLKRSAGLFTLSFGDFHGYPIPAAGRLGVADGPDSTGDSVDGDALMRHLSTLALGGILSVILLAGDAEACHKKKCGCAPSPVRRRRWSTRLPA